MRKWYELRGHAIQNRRIIMNKKDYDNGLLNELRLAIEFEKDRDIKKKLESELKKLESESYKFRIVKKEKEEVTEEPNEDI